MSMPVIETERLVLRAPCPEDLSACAELLGDYEVAKMLSRVPYPYDLEGGRAYLARSVERWQDVAGADEIGFHVDHDGEMIGGMGFKKLQETPEIGYWLGRPYWGKGFMSEAVEAAVTWLFRNTDHERLAGEAMTENAGSLKVLEKLGFRLVGEVGCASVSRGATVPALRMEVTKTEFLNGR
ncbi:GNAT family N-acetyltransferase [Roseibium sediminicola]|uniref:GNAT family N-acetyltransferase n=1 Tax=Roseibium sediminicola TaxID=2933272 RepID=A0ABT0GW77_9HYPH|nr:GNAT family N-acetyltransferase [Roseibium sp. CAU 1639]MCK7613698.1 GNAT family N-acetyltransferase [Roseibium sp. CAU 1639]